VVKINKKGQQYQELFWFLFLAGLFTVISFVIFLEYKSGNPRVKDNDFSFYVMGWSFFVPLGLIISYLLKKISALLTKDFNWYGPLATFFNFIFLLYLLYPGAWKLNSNWAAMAGFFLVQILVFSAVKLLKLNTTQRPLLEKYLWLVMIGLFVIWILSLTWNSLSFSLFNTLFGCAFVGLLYFSMSGKKSWDNNSSLRKKLFLGNDYFYYFAVFVFILLMVVDLNFNIERYHATYFLGPLSDLVGGKSLLANINGQYGIYIFYFLSLFFKILPLGFKSFCFVLTSLTIIQYFCFYFVARHLFNSKLYSFLCLIVLLMVNHFATVGYMTQYPSVGPLRFGFIYLLLMIIIFRNRYPEYKNYFYIAEAAVAAIAIFWSFEVGVYTVPAYLGLMFYESVLIEGGIEFNWKLLARRVAYMICFCLPLLGFIYLDVFQRTHELPHWSYYFDYIFYYKGGFDMLPVDPIGVWWLMIGILLFSLFIVLGGLTKTKELMDCSDFNAVVLLTFYGITQFLYFMGRAHPNNLFHVSMPSILLGAYWLYWLGKNNLFPIHPLVKKTVFAVSAVSLGLYLPLVLPRVFAKLNENLPLYSSLPQRFWDAANNRPPYENTGFAEAADSLIGKYSGNKKEVVYLFGESGLDVSMCKGRINALPFNDIDQVERFTPIFKRISSFIPTLSAGDYIYIAWQDTGNGVPGFESLENTILDNLNRTYDFKLIEKSKEGIYVFQVADVKPKATDTKTLKPS
jgi:hypothetical protein